MAKRGRKPKDYRTPDGKTIPGLYLRPDGRWRIAATGQTFRELDWRTAVARFEQESARLQRQGDVALPLSIPVHEAGQQYVAARDAMHKAGGNRLRIKIKPNEPAEFSFLVGSDAYWEATRRLLLNEPELCAQKTGIAALRTLAQLPLPRDPIRLTALIKAYDEHADASDIAKRRVREAWAVFIELTGAKTLPQLTPQAFTQYGDTLKKKDWCADYIGDHFSRVKRVIRFGLRRGMDSAQLRAALDHAAVLVPPRATKKYAPKPIKPSDFHSLLKHGTPMERAALLLALNCCLHLSEVLNVRRTEIDEQQRTFVTRRAKTGIIRAAVLWPRTIEALSALPARDDAIFVSSQGQVFHPTSFRRLFSKLRKRAKVSSSVEFNQIRDAAYTAAVKSGVAEQFARVLAGHRAPGLADHYIERQPQMTEPACDAIERAFFA